ncbi:MAG: DUF4124 domain-containing protein [Bermanella sp.]
MKLIPLLFLMVFTISSHAGQAYKTVDENGNITFSQFPPSDNNDTETINVKTQKSSSASQSKKALESSRQKLLESSVDRTAEKKEENEKAERMAENCEKANQKLRDIQNNGRIYKTLKDGERHWYDEKERQQLINEAKDQVKQYCK